jgi:hypothetical protein
VITFRSPKPAGEATWDYVSGESRQRNPSSLGHLTYFAVTARNPGDSNGLVLTQRVTQICDEVVDVFESDRDSQQGGRRNRIDSFNTEPVLNETFDAP